MTTPARIHHRVVLATHNRAKLDELRRIVFGAAPDIWVVGLEAVAHYPEPQEKERTFEGNALIKARACCQATGMPALADDSGLAVDVLNGMPGVRSARWAGRGATDDATMSCCCAARCRAGRSATPDSSAPWPWCCLAAEHVRRRWQAGWPADLRATGFGYDPLFVADGQTMTNGELEAAAKDSISHQGHAVRAIVPVLISELRRLGVREDA